MQRMLIVLLLVISPISTGAAGELTGKGIKFGLNIADQSTSEHFHLRDAGFGGGGQKSLIGLCIGGFITYSFNDWFALQPEIMWTIKGAKYKEEGTSTYVQQPGDLLYERSWENEETWRLTYVEIPVLAKLSAPLTETIYPHFLIGPAVGFKIKSKVHWQWTGMDDLVVGAADSLWDEGGKDDIEDLGIIELNVVAGAGVDFELYGGAKIILEARYTAGLSKNASYAVNFSKDEWDRVEQSGLALRNRVFTIILGYSF